MCIQAPALGLAATLEGASELDLSEWELSTEALVDPEPNAEFSLSVICPLLLARCAPASFRVQGDCM